MASSLPSFHGLCRLSPRHKVRKSPRAKAQSFGDEGLKGKSSRSVVDENLSVLKERMEMVRMQERLMRSCRHGEGWYYPSAYDSKLQRDAKLSESFKVAVLILGSLGLTILSGTLCLCLISLLVYLGG